MLWIWLKKLYGHYNMAIIYFHWVVLNWSLIFVGVWLQNITTVTQSMSLSLKMGLVLQVSNEMYSKLVSFLFVDQLFEFGNIPLHISCSRADLSLNCFLDFFQSLLQKVENILRVLLHGPTTLIPKMLDKHLFQILVLNQCFIKYLQPFLLFFGLRVEKTQAFCYLALGILQG